MNELELTFCENDMFEEVNLIKAKVSHVLAILNTNIISFFLTYPAMVLAGGGLAEPLDQ